MWVKLRSDQVKGRISEVEDDQHENKHRGRKQTKECQRYVGYNEGSNTYMTEVPEETQVTNMTPEQIMTINLPK